jgi:hypothetical protein
LTALAWKEKGEGKDIRVKFRNSEAKAALNTDQNLSQLFGTNREMESHSLIVLHECSHSIWN